MIERNGAKGEGLKRYNLILPSQDFEKIRQVAKERHTSVVHVLRQFIALGLFVDHSSANGGKLILKEGDKETELIVI